MNHDKMTSEGGKIWRETNGFAVLRNATLRQLRNEAAALKEADSKWRSLSQEERDERNRVAKAIWDAANPPVETPEERAAAALAGSQRTQTPVSVLQELCVKRHMTPKYDLIQIEGPDHEPTFKYRVTVGEYIEHGTGRSKKMAQHAAAKAVVGKLIGNSNTMKNGSSTAAAASDFAEATKAEVSAPFEDGIPGNPVAALQDFCTSMMLSFPIYQLSAEDGLPHERSFTIDCIIGKNTASGTGKSKKLAKRQAAHRLLQKLKNSQPDNPQE